jgi:hypothetical protein
MLCIRTPIAAAALAVAALWPAQSPGLRSNDPQLAVACPNTGELVIDDIKICYFTCPDMSTSIRIGADQICPPFH